MPESSWFGLLRSVGLVRGEAVAVDGSKFQAVSSAKSLRERDAVKRYVEQLDAADAQDEVVIDCSAVHTAVEKLQSDPEPEARFMRTAHGIAPAYNVQTAVDAEHALIVVQKVTDEATDNRSLLPMAEAAKQAVGDPSSLNLVADAGYSNGEQAETCEAQGIVLHVPAPARCKQPRRRHTVRPPPVSLRREDRHLSLPRRSDALPQTSAAAQDASHLCG